MQTHPLDGDGLNVELFKVLGRVSRISVVNEALPFRIPDTILYYGSASYWYYFDEQTNSVQKHPAKSLEKTNVYEKFCIPKPTDRSDVVACFCSSKTESMDVTYYDREGLWRFLFSEKRQERYGILQRFIEPKMDFSETVQVVHSPTMTFAVRRQNRTKLYDRTVDINLRCCGFDGPSFQCEEYFCLQNRTGAYRDMCESFVHFFSSIEPSFTMKRLVAYFRHGSDDNHYLLFTTSVRIVERVDPELEQLWGKKVVPYQALKQSLANVATTWHPSSTTTSSASGSKADQGTGGGQQQTVANGALSGSGATLIGGKLLQPLSLLPKDQLDKLVSVPSRAKEIEALTKQLRGGEANAKRKAIRPVPQRLLSPFQTVSTPEPIDERVAGANARTATPSSIKAQRIEDIRRRARQIDIENEAIRKRLDGLQRDAASLCMMNELDKMVRRKPIPDPSSGWASDDSDGGSFREDGGPGSPHRPLNLWQRTDSVVVTADASPDGIRNAPPSNHPTFDQDSQSNQHHLTATILASEVDSNGAFGNDSHGASMRSTRSVKSTDAAGGDHMPRSSSIVAGASIRMRKRRSIVGSKRDLSRPGFSPRAYATRPMAATAQRLLEASAALFTKERVRYLMDAAARLSDIFYPLAEVIAARRKVLPRFTRPDLTYGEEGGNIAVTEEGIVTFAIPRDLVLTVKRELGVYWSCLRIYTCPCSTDSDASVPTAAIEEDEDSDGPWSPSFEEWEAHSEGASDESTKTVPHLRCTIRPPFVNPSAYTFASKKLQELAEKTEHESTRYAQLASNAVTQHFHYDIAEGIAEGAQALQQRLQAQRSTDGGAAVLSEPKEAELHPVANRARRSSMLQQLRGIRATVTVTSTDADGTQHLSAVSPDVQATSSGAATPRSQQATSAASTNSTPAELTIADVVRQAQDAGPDEESTSVSRATGSANRTPPGEFVLSGAPVEVSLASVSCEESKEPQPTVVTPLKKVLVEVSAAKSDEAPGTPEWLK